MGKAEVIASLRAQINAVTPQDSHVDSSGVAAPTSARPEAAASTFTTDRTPSQAQADDDDEMSRAFKKAVALINASDKSEKTIRAKLSDAEFSEAAIETTVQRCKEYGFIDDRRFADVLIRSRISQGKGMAGIARELKSHDIDPSSLPGWPYEYEEGLPDEFDRALALLNAKPPRSKNLRDGAYRKLVTKGFSSSVAASAARSWAETQQRYD